MDELDKLMMKLPRVNLINLMGNALDEMQHYNGRTHYYCIMQGIGAEEVEEEVEEEGGTWILPTLKVAKEHTNS